MLVQRWISHFGIPFVITTDQGRQFESGLWCQLMKLLGTKQIHTTTYHPIANGLVEVFYCQLKTALKAQPNIDNWVDHLPMVLLKICTALKDNFHCAAAMMVYGTTYHLPVGFFCQQWQRWQSRPMSYVAKLTSTMQQLSATPPHCHSWHKAYISKDLAYCMHIFVCQNGVQKPLKPPYNRRYKIIHQND